MTTPATWLALVAPGVVNTMPEATLRAVAGHGEIPPDSVHGSYPGAREVLSQLESIGLDYAEIVQALEDDGVRKFDASWQQLSEQLAATLRRLSPGSEED